VSLRDLVFRPGVDSAEAQIMPYYPDRDTSRVETLPYYPEVERQKLAGDFLEMFLNEIGAISGGPELPDLPINRLPRGIEPDEPEAVMRIRNYLRTDPAMQRRYGEVRRKYGFGV